MPQGLTTQNNANVIKQKKAIKNSKRVYLLRNKKFYVSPGKKLIFRNPYVTFLFYFFSSFV